MTKKPPTKTKPHPHQLLMDFLDGVKPSISLASSMAVTAMRQPDGAILVKPGKVQLEGSVRDAMRALGLTNTKIVIRLILEGHIDGHKPRKTSPNCKYRVNMLTVYALKEKWEAERAEARA